MRVKDVELECDPFKVSAGEWVHFGRALAPETGFCINEDRQLEAIPEPDCFIAEATNQFSVIKGHKARRFINQTPSGPVGRASFWFTTAPLRSGDYPEE